MQTHLGTFNDIWLAAGAAAMFVAFLLSGFNRVSKPRIAMFVLLLLWGGYAVYEWRMQVWSHTVIAPIRLDLVLIVPVLIVVSTRAWTSLRADHRAA